MYLSFERLKAETERALFSRKIYLDRCYRGYYEVIKENTFIDQVPSGAIALFVRRISVAPDVELFIFVIV